VCDSKSQIGTSEKALRGTVITEFSYDNWIGFGTKNIARVYIYSWLCNIEKKTRVFERLQNRGVAGKFREFLKEVVC